MAEEAKVDTAIAVPVAAPVSEETSAAAVGTSDAPQEGTSKESAHDSAPTKATDTIDGPVLAVPAVPEPTTSTDKDAVPQEASTEDVNGVQASADATEGAEGADATTNGTTDAAKKDKKRKSSSGVPEHKSKKLNKRKSMPQLQLEVEPVICDEQMLPVSLLSKRPVSAKRVDGTWRSDFEVGGKNVRDRRYPVMFLATNEFAWQPNTDLLPLNIDEVKEKVENGNQGKMPNKLWEAYQIAASEYSLDHFKSVLMEHEKALVEEQEALEQEEERLRQLAEEREKEKAEQAEKKKEKADQQKGKKKAKANGDVEMADADGTAKAAKSKKRKNTEEGDDGGKPPKTPKLKLTNKTTDTPTAESEAKPKKASKPAAKKSTPKAGEPKEEKKQETEAEKFEKRQKLVLFLRHRLQKGFLDKNAPPDPDNMPDMSQRLAELEKHENLEVSIIKTTKINKVLKQLLRIENIPRDDEFDFKQRATDLLVIYNKSMELEAPTPAPVSAGADATKSEEPQTKTNGVGHDEFTNEGASPEEKTEVKSIEVAESKKDSPKADSDGDVPMTDAKVDATAAEDVPKPVVETAAEAPVATVGEPTTAA